MKMSNERYSVHLGRKNKYAIKHDNQKNGTLKKRLKQHWQLYLLLLPAVIYLAIFNYGPLYGLLGAFKDFKPHLGYWNSPWVGLEHFERFFTSNSFSQIVPNTIILSMYSLIASFPLPIVLALCLNYIPSLKFKKLVQNITYAPHFVSVVVIVSMISIFFGYDTGFVNNIRELLGLERVMFTGSPENFRHLYVWSGVWQSVGWSSVIYVASLSGVDPALHESAVIDGATILQRIRYIDLPTISPTIVTLLILNSGKIMSVGFDKVFLMQNSLNLTTSEVISTYVYKMGLVNSQYGYSTAVGIFNSVVNILLLVITNIISRKFNETSIW